MISGEILSKLRSPRKKTANILAPDTPPFDDGKKEWWVAGPKLRAIAQNIIDHIDEHRHLRGEKGAKVLLLVKKSEADAKKLNAGEFVNAGKASKANPQLKLLSAIGMDTDHQADFVVWLSHDCIERLCSLDDDGVEVRLEDVDGICKIFALIEHELLHCSAKIAGEFVAADNLEAFVEEMGERHIETCKDVAGEAGTLVRYYFLDKQGRYVFKIRKHDVEEFQGVVERHGAWARSLGRLIDVLVESQKDLFSKAS